jgi:hypothetical protein
MSAINTDSTKLSESCGGMANYNKMMVFTPEQPLPWDTMIVSSEDLNGNPLISEYYLGDIFQFKVTKTFNAESVCMSIVVS